MPSNKSVYLATRKGGDEMTDKQKFIKAAEDGDIKTVKEMLERKLLGKIYIRASDEHGCTALIKASRFGYQDVAELLIASGADGKMAVDIARKNKYPKAALLIEKLIEAEKTISEKMADVGAIELSDVMTDGELTRPGKTLALDTDKAAEFILKNDNLSVRQKKDFIAAAKEAGAMPDKDAEVKLYSALTNRLWDEKNAPEKAKIKNSALLNKTNGVER